MGELWGELVETIRRRPAIVLPVLLADLLGYLLNLGRSGLVRLLVLHQTAQHSALGGTVGHGPMSASALQSTTVLVLLLSWVVYFLRVLFYVTALFATVAMVDALRQRASSTFGAIGPTLARYRTGIFDLALRALAIYAVAALLLSWLSPRLIKAGHGALLRNNWFIYGVTLLVLLVLSALLSPAALRIMAGRRPTPPIARSAQLLAALLAVVAAALSTFVNANARELSQVTPGARYPLELVGSLVTALPYILLFTGLAVLERRVTDPALDTTPDTA